ncbi:M48 family metallopeptidase [Flavivirga amylovorans]|uniref:M48 family metallopeptidase n=1 Tax=Flavivirga amylovorans TaxID=870486 RepID=A0ABT8WX31_9FLAO|nr:M48 family metallopeptidase [Flavivirga amylovorans]MDO5986246.1 M48 family metallopeptidase [Flavivirga amylovorans]
MLITFNCLGQQIGNINIEDLIGKYSISLNEVEGLNDCGHILDGPLYVMKTFENKSLDAALPFANLNTNEIGKEIYEKIIESNKVLDNHWAESDINNVIKRLTAQMEPRDKKVFKLNIIDSEIINAFTTYGGFIYITTGLIEFVESYDELAFIIGHEIGHEINLHTQRKITKLMIPSNVLSQMNLDTLKNVVVSLNTKFSAPFDQIDEYEADKYGVMLAYKAGFDSTRFADFFKKMEKYDDKSILKKISSTHPFAEHRKNCINKYIAE